MPVIGGVVLAVMVRVRIAMIVWNLLFVYFVIKIIISGRFVRFGGRFVLPRGRFVRGRFVLGNFWTF